MLAFAIADSSVKGFMNRLLREDIFDLYEVRGVEINTLTRVEISGALTPSRHEEAAPAPGGRVRPFCTWSQLRPLVHAIIKLGERPRSMKIIFACDESTTAALHPNAQALFLNLTYENGGVTFTTATAQKQFALDKSLDAQWEDHVAIFFKRNGIPMAPLS